MHCDGQRTQCPDDVVQLPSACAEFKALHAPRQCSQDRLALQACQACTRAQVDPIAKAKMTRSVARHIEGVCVFPLALIAIGRGEQHDNACSRWNRDTLYIVIARGQTTEALERRLQAQDLLEGVRDE